MRGLLVFITILFTSTLFAQESVRHGYTAAENQWMAEQNSSYARSQMNNPSLFGESSSPLSFNLIQQTSARPWAEYENAGYLIFNSQFDFGSKEAKLKMAENLPKNMKLVVYYGSLWNGAEAEIRNQFKDVIEADRLITVYMPRGGRGFWARDGVPVPVIRHHLKEGELFTLVDAVYYHKFEPDKEFSYMFDTQITTHNYYFEGGNFIVNSIGECLVVNKIATQRIPDSVFKDHYGCANLVRLPHVKGIGHADESVKFVNDKTVLTDEPTYVKQLKANGYNVFMLPRPKYKYETYVNSLLVNGVLFVPVFDQNTDQKALEVYGQFGFDKIVPVNSEKLSNNGLGSLHCITMTYPPVDEVALKEYLKSQP